MAERRVSTSRTTRRPTVRRATFHHGDLRRALVEAALTLVADDRYAPPSAVQPLVAAFTAARTERLTVAPARLGVPRIGHFGAFRPEGQPLWEEWRDWLLEGVAVEPAVDLQAVAASAA